MCRNGIVGSKGKYIYNFTSFAKLPSTNVVLFYKCVSNCTRKDCINIERVELKTKYDLMSTDTKNYLKY